MSGWRHAAFDNVIADESGGNLKTPQSEFLPSGRYAIVDQGKELVAGYTNDESRLCHAQLPVIVFGDHTRCFKYIDFPFCMGADGVKVLRPKVEADAKYLYHYLRQVRLTEGGYDRHFKYLKRIGIPLPPLPEQRRIAEILDKADALRAKRRAALAQLDSLTQSIFLDLFGRPKDNPNGWPLVSLMEICSPKQWPTISTADLTETGFPVFGANGLIGNYIKYNHEEPTVLITCRGATCGTINVSPPKCYVTGNAMALDDPDPNRITIDYLAAVLGLRSMTDTISGTAQPQITRQNLGHVKLPLPPLTLQSEFARRGAAVELVKSRHHKSLTELDALFVSLQHRAFSGEL